jgi:predicted alpha/beta hydrolase
MKTTFVGKQHSREQDNTMAQLPQPETVTFFNEQGQKLVGSIWTASGRETRNIAILSHGLRGNRLEPLLQKIASYLIQQSLCNVMTFDFRGNGDSEGDFSYSNYDEEVSDLCSAVQWLRQKRNAHVRLILGHSKGELFQRISKPLKSHISSPIFSWWHCSSLCGQV